MTGLFKNVKFKIVNCSRGFTLLEMTIAIAIIGFLIGIGSLSYLSVLKSGRDSARQSDLKRVQSALEMYYSDNHSYIREGNCAPGDWVELTDLHGELTGSRYIDELPCDPLDNNDSAPCDVGDDARYYYCAAPNNLCYCLAAKMERDTAGYVEGGCDSKPPESDETFYYLTCP